MIEFYRVYSIIQFFSKLLAMDHGLDEVDAFNANKEKVLLEEAGKYGQMSNGDESSEEEVMGLDEDEDDEEEEEVESEEGEGSEEEVDSDSNTLDWGGRKNYYGGEENEDVKLMTEEAMKQQKKHLQDLAMDDYVDEDVMEDWQKTAELMKEDGKDEQSLLVQVQQGLKNLSSKEKLKLLNAQFPEFVPLLNELNELQVVLEQLEEVKSEVSQVKASALRGYLGAVTSYFAMMMESLNGDEGFSSMKESPIMESILGSREVWRQANELGDGEEVEEEEGEVEEGEEEDVEENVEDVEVEEEDSEISEADASEEEESGFTIPDISSKRTIKSSKPKSSDFAESATPDDVDMEDKQRRKKTLRFYTSRIDQAANKNNQERFAGDLDLPYKERLFERQQRLVEEARKRGMAEKDVLGGDDSAGEDDFGSGGEDFAEELESSGDKAADSYYDSIKQDKHNKKETRRNAHEQAVRAAKEGKLLEVQENLGEDGKRAVNFQILKNKGLTPHRNKDNRNSRVKKRKKYEKAQKKLKSVRQVYDDSNRGPYEGEKTGIKKGITRSVKLV